MAELTLFDKNPPQWELDDANTKPAPPPAQVDPNWTPPPPEDDEIPF